MDLQSIVQVIVGVWFAGMIFYYVYKMHQQDKKYKKVMK